MECLNSHACGLIHSIHYICNHEKRDKIWCTAILWHNRSVDIFVPIYKQNNPPNYQKQSKVSMPYWLLSCFYTKQSLSVKQVLSMEFLFPFLPCCLLLSSLREWAMKSYKSSGNLDTGTVEHVNWRSQNCCFSLGSVFYMLLYLQTMSFYSVLLVTCLGGLMEMWKVGYKWNT